MRRVEYYRSVEHASRVDADEGQGYLRVPGDVPAVTVNRETMEVAGRREEPGYFNWRLGFLNPTYILCFSDARVGASFLSKRYGRYVVAIHDPRVFVESSTRMAVGRGCGAPASRGRRIGPPGARAVR